MQTVLFLGAGAAVPDGLPSTDEVAKRVRDILASQKVHETFLLPQSLDLFIASPTGESLTRVVNDIRTAYQKTPDLMIILWYSLLAAAQAVTDTPTVGVNGWRKKLLSYFLERDGALCVLTTNWDTSLDSICELLRLEHTQSECVDYGVQFSGRPYRPQIDLPIRLLKLNGASDWFFCDSCRELSTANMIRTERGISASIDLNTSVVLCRRCKGWMDRPLVLPALGSAHNPIADYSEFTKLGDRANIHVRAAAALASAQEVIFIGYSLPSYDSTIKTLLKVGLEANDAVRMGHASFAVVTLGSDIATMSQRYGELFCCDFALHGDGLQGFVSTL